MSHKIFSFILLVSISIFSQAKNPESILERVKAELKKIEDYKVDVKIKVDVYFLKMPDREATIFYKQPDKIHIESEGFVMLPKEGLNFSPLGLLKSKYSAFYEREDTIKGITTSKIKIIPLESSSDVILSTLWIDTRRNIIVRIESSRKPLGTFVIDLDYLKIEQEYWLPSSMVFTFSIDRSVLPRGFNVDADSESRKALEDSTKTETGTVYLNYSNYKVNTGLSDEIFDKKDSKK
jgi:outer membrane lipoprotein-sorting protein